MSDLKLKSIYTHPSENLRTKNLKKDDDPLKLGLGTNVLFWHGDDSALGTKVGGVPNGYLSRPFYKQWTRGVDDNGHFSFGPYHRIEGTGSFRVWFFIEVTNRGNSKDKVVTVDISDYDGGKALCGPTTFNVKDFPKKTDGFIIYSPDMKIPSNNRIETRLFTEGGATLKLWSIRWEIDTL